MEININELRSYFKERGISQREIADAMGVSPAYINSIFTGKRNVGKNNAEKLQEKFGISASWLLTGEGSMLLGDVSGDNNAIGHGASVTHSDCCNIVDKFLGELAEQRKLVSESQRQVDRLLSIIEKMTNNI